MSRKLSKITDETMRIILIILGSVFSCLVLVFVSLAIVEMQNGNLFTTSVYLLNIFIVLGLSRLITFLKERTRITFLRFVVLLIFNVILGIVILFAKNEPYLFQLCGGLFCLSILLSSIFQILRKRTIRNVILHAIIALFAVLLGIGLLIPQAGKTDTVILILCVIVAISAFIEVISASTSQLQLKVLFKIVLRTYALEIIMGLLTMMVAFSLILMLCEKNIQTFGDGLWYSFAVVTTIGFGDYVATTILGRLITVMLGIYGIVVVAVITSIIVNFYTEVSGKRDKETIKDIKDEVKNDKK